MTILNEQFVIDAKGRKRSVILSLRRYKQIMEDMHDLAVVAERRKEKVITLNEMKRRLKRNGRI
ncbi:MAG: type II toxin-antitoxin system Phd/YefM family antitoxin [Planctomycetes bacterium]|nr:type II toxin-antitoxin system Phd/YefM family antitoxin [Planctomycetota bacterium]